MKIAMAINIESEMKAKIIEETQRNINIGVMAAYRRRQHNGESWRKHQ
jgi:hypothetical protein